MIRLGEKMCLMTEAVLEPSMKAMSERVEDSLILWDTVVRLDVGVTHGEFLRDFSTILM